MFSKRRFCYRCLLHFAKANKQGKFTSVSSGFVVSKVLGFLVRF